MYLIIIGLLLDSLLSNYFPYFYNLTLFQPSIFCVILVFLYFKIKNEKLFLRQGLLFAIIGSLITGNILIIKVASFLLISFFLHQLKENYKLNFVVYILGIIGAIFINLFTSYLIYMLLTKTNLSIINFFNLYIHTILFNIILSTIIYYFGIKKLPR